MLPIILIFSILSFLGVCILIYLLVNYLTRILDENERLVNENEGLRLDNDYILSQIQEFHDYFRDSEEFNRLMKAAKEPIIKYFKQYFLDLYTIINKIIRREYTDE